jgi:hypothetical protein
MYLLLTRVQHVVDVFQETLLHNLCVTEQEDHRFTIHTSSPACDSTAQEEGWKSSCDTAIQLAKGSADPTHSADVSPAFSIQAHL